MDKQLLASKGFEVGNAQVGSARDFALRISKRATLLPRLGSRAYGVVATMSESDVSELYADQSVSDYVPEELTVELESGDTVVATCYNLPPEKITGTNADYARSLLQLATRLELPEAYLEEIRSFIE